MISQDTLNKVQEFCAPAINTGMIPENEFKELMQSPFTLPPSLNPNLLTKKKVSEFLTISVRQLDRLHDKGKIQYIRVGDRAIRIPEYSFKEYLINNAV